MAHFLAFANALSQVTVLPLIVSATALGFIVKPEVNISGSTIKLTSSTIALIFSSK